MNMDHTTDIIVTKEESKMQMQENEIVLYQPNEAIHLEVRIEEDTVWLNRNQMAIPFGRDVKTIGKHVNNVLREELQGMATVAKFAIVQNEGGLATRGGHLLRRTDLRRLHFRQRPGAQRQKPYHPFRQLRGRHGADPARQTRRRSERTDLHTHHHTTTYP